MSDEKTSFAKMAEEAKSKEQEKEKIRLVLSNTISTAMCTVCGHKSWGMIDGVFKLVDESGASGTVFDVFSSSVPVVCCACQNCGNIILFSAQMIR